MTWYPRDKYSWDFWFAWDKENKLHVFYLQASQLECAYNPERRHNLSSVGHAVLTDYGWQEVSLKNAAFEAKPRHESWDDLSIWTGSIIQENDKYYMFYTARTWKDRVIPTPHERLRPQRIGVAISGDLKTWERAIEKPVIPNPGHEYESEFDGVNWRDPYVIKDESQNESQKRFYAFICARPQNAAPDADGTIAIASATIPTTEGKRDLAEAKWQTEKEDYLYKSEEFYQIEVPQVFWRKFSDSKNGNYWRLYLLFCPQEKDASSRRVEPRTGTYYLRSRKLKEEERKEIQYTNIPWEEKSAKLLADGLYGGKIVSDRTDREGFEPNKNDRITGKKPVFFGFQFEDKAGKFVGGLSDPRWVKFNDDGSIKLYLDKELKTLDPDLQ
jgi:beta-fructofuranosidase